ncbi:MAG: glycosyltransferase family 4 protein [gamma proteobacterium symbiont of Taylorina sp.]|nr:glycosyltransferase family 4 protein [gamma proteobacterium symbiont of Taylorina sp.]
MKKKTLLVLASTFPRWLNDTEPRFVYDLCQGLKKEFNIIVLTSHSSGSKIYEEMNGLTVYRYQYAPAYLETLVYNGGITNNLKHNKFKYLLLPTFFISQLFSIVKILRKYPIFIIHAHWLIPQGFLALIAMKFFKKPLKLLCTSHGGDLFGLNDPMSTKIKKWVLKKSDTITVVSSAMMQKAVELDPDIKNKLSVIPMGSNLNDIFKPNPKIHREKNLLLFSGRLVEKKGVNTLINALAKVRKQYPDTILAIIGDGPEKESLYLLSKKLDISHSIQFTGRLSHSELSLWYAKATLSVFPFQQAKNGDIEGLGLVMIEALGCGCPVIAGDVPAIHDIIKHNKTGLIVEQKNSHLLATNIIQLLLSPEKRQYLAENGRKYVCNHFGWKTSTQQYIKILNQL